MYIFLQLGLGLHLRFKSAFDYLSHAYKKQSYGYCDENTSCKFNWLVMTKVATKYSSIALQVVTSAV